MPPKVNPTHFYPTTPQASSKSMASQTFPARASRTHPLKQSPGPPGETPQEKVRRLREAAARAREAQISPVDKFLVKGRVWADTAHRVTVMGLIGITGLATVVTVYALGDMMIYNRRKKHEFMVEQKHIYMSKVAEAREAIANNTASAEQIEFIELEEKLDRLEQERVNRKGIFRTVKEKLFSGLSKEDAAAGLSGTTSEGEEAQMDTARPTGGIMKAVEERREEIREGLEEKKKDVVDTIQEAWEKEKKLEQTGGMLDQIGITKNEEKPKSGGWTNWFSW